MNKYVWAARTVVVVAGATLLIQGVLPHPAGFGPGWFRRGSSDLLHDERSPFRQLDESVETSDVDVAQTVNEVQPPVEVVRTFEHMVTRGTTLASLWRDIGGRSEDVPAITGALKSSGVTPGDLKLGERLEVTHRNGEVVEVRKKHTADATVVLTRDDKGAYASRVERMKVVAKERRVTGTILSSLVDSASGLSIPYSLVDDFVDLFSSRVEFSKDLQPGDTFTVVYEDRVSVEGEHLAPGSIKAASIQLSGKMLAVVRDVAKDGTVRYFDEKGEMPTKAFLRYPLKYTRISSMFSHSRFHPVLKISRPHNGVDFSAPIGTPVRSVGEGTIIFSGYNASCGNMVRISHNSRYTTEYMHLNAINKGMRKGARVGRGDVIGSVGKTGLASGPHLHFGLFDKGRYIDPMKAKITSAPAPIRPPAAVLAMLEELKKAHSAVAVASKTGDKKA